MWVVVCISIEGYTLGAHLYMRHISAHKIKTIASLYVGVVVAEILPYIRQRPVKLDGPGCIIDRLKKFVPAKRAKDPRHFGWLANAVIPPYTACTIHRFGGRIRIYFQPSVRRPHGSRDRFHAVSIQPVDQTCTPVIATCTILYRTKKQLKAKILCYGSSKNIVLHR